MKKIVLTLGMALSLGISDAALAESKFYGVYAGLAVGVARSVNEGKEFKDYGASYYDVDQHTILSSGLFSPFVGFNYVMNNSILLGVEADYEKRAGSDTNAQKISGVLAPEYPVKTRFLDAGSLRAKLGYVFNGDKTLSYITGGYSVANIKRTYGELSIANTYSDKTVVQDGYTTGFGVEHFLTDRISIHGEYRYASYSPTIIDTSVIYGAGTLEKEPLVDHSLRIGVAYNF